MEGPRMDTDAHGSESDLTEAVIGSAFEAANVLGLDSSKRSMNEPRSGSLRFVVLLDR
jgi:hypothetical protein